MHEASFRSMIALVVNWFGKTASTKRLMCKRLEIFFLRKRLLSIQMRIRCVGSEGWKAHLPACHTNYLKKTVGQASTGTVYLSWLTRVCRPCNLMARVAKLSTCRYFKRSRSWLVCLLAKKIKILGKLCNPWCRLDSRRGVQVVGSYTTKPNLVWNQTKKSRHLCFLLSSRLFFSSL